MNKSIVCIGCPLGCRLTAEIETGSVHRVSGQSCLRGEAYARQEAVRPMRVLTGNMKAVSCQRPFSVITSKPIPKDMLLACAAELKRHHPQPPVFAGDRVIENILNTGCDVLATQDCPLPFTVGSENILNTGCDVLVTQDCPPPFIVERVER